MEYSDYTNGNIQAIFDSLEELTRYKNFKDLINKENKIHNSDADLKKSREMVINIKKRRDDK